MSEGALYTDREALAVIVEGLWRELGTVSALQTVTGCTREQILDALEVVLEVTPRDGR